jgi:c(7)-type cytochrome triheme protein
MRFTMRVVLAALALATAAEAGDLPRLPKAIALPRGEDSPGQVTFNHDTHVDAARPDCVSCHPRLFPILKESALPGGAITHEKMEKGQACGACHSKGKKAFAFEDGCENCHPG